MVFLGASGIFWSFVNRAERLVGGIILALGLGYGVTMLILTRLQI